MSVQSERSFRPIKSGQARAQLPCEAISPLFPGGLQKEGLCQEVGVWAPPALTFPDSHRERGSPLTHKIGKRRKPQLDAWSVLRVFRYDGSMGQ